MFWTTRSIPNIVHIAGRGMSEGRRLEVRRAGVGGGAPPPLPPPPPPPPPGLPMLDFLPSTAIHGG